MTNIGKVIVGLFGLVVLAVVLPRLLRYFSPKARERRRRERSHRKVVSRRQGLWVKLAVLTGKPKNGGKPR
jgi:hypothetical protein